MADKKKLSVAEILAAARKLDGGAKGEAEQPQAAVPAADAPAQGSQSTAGPAAAKSKPGERPSVAEMLAIARGEKQGAAAPEAATAAVGKPEKAPSEKVSQPKPAEKAKNPVRPSEERMDTASVLAAARRDSKRGPVSKAEAPELAARKPTQKTPAVKPDAPQIPERPVYASPPPKAAVDEGRRFVLITALFGSAFATGMTLLGTTVVVWVLALARFMFPNVLTEPPSQFKVGFSDDFAPGQVETKFKAQFGIWVVNSEYQGEQCIYALSTVCTHLGCTPNWLDSEQKFKCPCHGSGFYKDGINFEGPAPRPLERYSIRLASDGQLEVDKSRKFQEEMGQWQDPASFVPV
jgi:cytochrome b6-f complex iron-sulfur subunit